MVGGKLFFRGPHAGYSQNDARAVPISEENGRWLLNHLKVFLEGIAKPELYAELSDLDEWQLLLARSPHERLVHQRRSMADFNREVWEKELGPGGLIGDLTDLDRSSIPLVTTGELRRFVPLWENKKYKAPCEATCPTGIPVHDRWRLVREGRIDEAVDLALSFTPFPASVCGYLCPNVCMQSCTRQAASLPPVDITQLGKASVKAKMPELPPLSGKKIAVIGGGPAGISIAWQLRQYGHEAVVYDMSEKLGGKLTAVIPDSRLPKEVISTELERIRKVLPHVHLQQQLTQEETERLREDYDFLVIAAGAQKPSIIPMPGKELLTTALDFLLKAKKDDFEVGRRVVIIGAGNVGCDVATEAYRLGARDITLIDIQEPLSFGKEREAAEEIGAKFRYPCFTQEVTSEGVVLNDGELIPADTVFISIGDRPDLGFIPQDVQIDRGFIKVNEHYQTSDPKVFAVGDVVKPGLLTDAIGAGRKAAQAIKEILDGNLPIFDDREMIDRHRISLEYFDPRLLDFDNVDHCGSQCSSCGACRDCGICVNTCPQTAISRKDVDLLTGEYEYVVDDQKCIGCGFCAGACPCGIWNLVENEQLM
jgi:NADPH-dependent glutamate synthase beta subunit-like oxidoreductase/ferredoxin